MEDFLCCPEFSPTDEYVLDRLDKEKLKEWIGFLRSYREVLWKEDGYAGLVPLKKIRKRPARSQALPVYPETLKEMGLAFYEIFAGRPDFFPDLREAGFFTDGSFASRWTGTLWSPALAVALIADAYRRDRFFDGLFGIGADNGAYLKILLHLEDLIALREYRASSVPDREKKEKENC